MAPSHLSCRLQQKIFSTEKYIDIFEFSQIWLNVYMSGHRFEKIMTTLSFTDIPLTYFKEEFFEVCHIIVARNQQMKDVLIPLWFSSLYASISIWTKNVTLPG